MANLNKKQQLKVIYNINSSTNGIIWLYFTIYIYIYWKKSTERPKQSKWTNKGHGQGLTTPEPSLSLADIWQYEPLRLKFLLRSVYDVLPSPVNLCEWNLTDNPNCRLCEKRGTLDHILS